MPKPNLSDQFDQIVTTLLASPAAVAPNSGQQLADVAAIAAELRSLPRQDFKAALKAQLEGRTPMASKAVRAPEPRQSVTAFLTIKGAARAIEFYKKAFGAEEVARLNMPGDRIGYAALRIGGNRTCAVRQVATPLRPGRAAGVDELVAVLDQPSPHD